MPLRSSGSDARRSLILVLRLNWRSYHMWSILRRSVDTSGTSLSNKERLTSGRDGSPEGSCGRYSIRASNDLPGKLPCDHNFATTENIIEATGANVNDFWKGLIGPLAGVLIGGIVTGGIQYRIAVWNAE